MIDWVRVSDLRSEIGAESFVEVTELFLEEADEAVARMTGKPDPSTVEAALHFLKGSALNLGFNDLAGLCQEGERCAAAGAAASVDLGRVVQCYQDSKTQFLAGLARLSAA